jgi:preprotein translocase subunit SecB
MADQPRLEGVDFTMKPPSGDFSIRKIYVKDLSFETPHSPAIFATEWKPDADVNLRTAVLALDPGEYEVTLSITVTVNVGERTAFLAEVAQSGIFHIVGLTQDELQPVVGAYCPAILYPYAREVVSDLVMRGGFPPFVLSPVNFDALFEHQRAGVAEHDTPDPDAG